MFSIRNTFLTKCEVSTHEAIKRVLSLPMRHPNVDALYVPTGLKKNESRLLKSLSVLEKMHPDDRNVFASNIIDKYKHQPDHLHSMCLAEFASNYVSKKTDDLPIEPDDVNKLNPIIIVLKNELGEIQKHSQP